MSLHHRVHARALSMHFVREDAVESSGLRGRLWYWATDNQWLDLEFVAWTGMENLTVEVEDGTLLREWQIVDSPMPRSRRRLECGGAVGRSILWIEALRFGQATTSAEARHARGRAAGGSSVVKSQVCPRVPETLPMDRARPRRSTRHLRSTHMPTEPSPRWTR